MGKEDIVIINQGLEQRTNKTSGKVRYVMTMKTEPVVFNLDAKKFGADVTRAMIHHLKERVKGIAQQAAAATLQARKVEAKAFNLGKPWALRRNSGGKTGATPPSATETRAFNNSGRFANSITGSASSDGSWRINIAANRMNPTMSIPQRVYARLVQLVPEFGDPALLLQNDIVRKARDKAVENMRVVERSGRFKQAAELVRMAIGLAGEVGELLA